MKVIDNIIQGSEEWKRCRLGKMTSSRFGDFMKKGRGGAASETALSYIAQLTTEVLLNEPTEMFQSKDMVWGTETEPQARAFYQLVSGNDVREVAFIQHDNPYIGASPDGLIGINGGLEIKCPKTYTQVKRFLNDTGLPDEYKYQVYGQMYVGELEWVDFVSFDPRIDSVATYLCTRVYRDESIIKGLDENLSFYSDLLQESIFEASKPLEF